MLVAAASLPRYSELAMVHAAWVRISKPGRSDLQVVALWCRLLNGSVAALRGRRLMPAEVRHDLLERKPALQSCENNGGNGRFFGAACDLNESLVYSYRLGIECDVICWEECECVATNIVNVLVSASKLS